ncbi:retrovirus-related Pol polyprotein from transposon 17.6 [Trichonephila clavipes]|nr:retrovirus-related Pol polyprotein from transposon 17.6 [Trichonephila clavipes]
MPLGLCNASATFERLMETVLRGLSCKACLVYLDDIIIVGRSFEEHLKNIRRVLQKLKETSLKLSPSKCHLFWREVTYLGQIIKAEIVRIDPDKILAVKDWNCQTDVQQLRSFLGICTYYRKFVNNFSTIATPLHKLTEAKQKFIFTVDCNNDFNKLKEAPVPAYPEIGKQFILDTDASHESIGAVVSPEIDGQERVMAYFSKCLSKPERNHCVTRKELLAIVKAVEHVHPYLYSRRFLLRTDHASVTWLLNFKNSEGQAARWIQRQQEYVVEIHHRKGSEHGNADALSRRELQILLENRKELWRNISKSPPSYNVINIRFGSVEG